MGTPLSEIIDLRLRQRLRAALEGSTTSNLPQSQIDAPAPAQTPARGLPKGRYSRPVVLAWFANEQVPLPVFEYKFCAERKWAFDLAWPDQKVALEVQGGLWRKRGGAHQRSGAVRDMKKFTAAAILRWRILYCQPRELCTLETVRMIRMALYSGAKP